MPRALSRQDVSDFRVRVGAAAAALATRSWAGAGAPDTWRVRVPGGELGVRVADAADGPHVHLSGPAALVFDGTIRL